MIILATAIGSMSGSEVNRSLRANPEVTRIIGTDIHSEDVLPNAVQVDVFHQTPKAVESDFVDRLVQICKAESVTHVLVLTDPEVDVLSSHRDRFISIGTLVCTPDAAAVQSARDKWVLFERFQHTNLVETIPSALGNTAEVESISFPRLIKPRNGRSSEGVRKVMDASQAMDATDEDIVQPLLTGDIYTVDVVRDPNGLSVSIARREIVRTHNGAGLVVDVFRDAGLEAEAEHVVTELGLQGAVNVEFLKVDGRYLLMDVNPRFSAGIAFTRLAGYDVVRNHIRCFNHQPIDALPVIRNTRYAKVFTELEMPAV